MSGTTRRSALLRIMEIETQLKNLVLDNKYYRIKDNLRMLREKSFFGDVRVNDPHNFDSMINLRRNSADSRECIEVYEKMSLEYEDLIDKLSIEKKQLQVELFG